MTRIYTALDGTKYPLVEARYNIAFRIYKSDRSKAVPGDPHNCLLALGMRRDRNVLDVYIGAGFDAYVVFKGDSERPAQAVHLTIPSRERRKINEFDKARTAATMLITLRRPTAGRTLDARS